MKKDLRRALRRGLRGSFTVEMAIVFPVVLLTIFGIMYLTILQYQNMTAATAAMRTAARSAAYWDQMGEEGAWDFQASSSGTSGGRMVAANFTEHDPYRYFFDGNNDRREANALAYMNWLLSKEPAVWDNTESTGTPVAQKTGGILQKYITVSVEKTYINPFGNLLERVGIRPPTEAELTANAPLSAPAEFMRNASFIYELVEGRGN